MAEWLWLPLSKWKPLMPLLPLVPKESLHCFLSCLQPSCCTSQPWCTTKKPNNRNPWDLLLIAKTNVQNAAFGISKQSIPKSSPLPLEFYKQSIPKSSHFFVVNFSPQVNKHIFGLKESHPDLLTLPKSNFEPLQVPCKELCICLWDLCGQHPISIGNQFWCRAR